MNYIYRISAQDGSVYYVKQALEKAKDRNILSKDLAKISRDRIKFEYKTITILKNLVFNGDLLKLPNIILFDRLNSILVTQDLGIGSLQKNLENGVFDVSVARNVGSYLFHQHTKTFNKEIIIRKSIGEEVRHWNFFLSLRTKNLLQNNFLSDLKEEITAVYKNGINHSFALLMHMDFCPKNILFSNKKDIAILDFEFSSGIGDPAYDLGFLIGHYLLFTIMSIEKKPSLDSLYEIYNNYIKSIQDLPFSKDIDNRVWKYAACTLLYRIAGASPASYIKPNYMDKIIKIGRGILKRNDINRKKIQEIIE